MAAFAGHRVDEGKAPEPIKSLLRALGEMGYSVGSWDVDITTDTYNLGSRSGDFIMPTGLVDFTIHVSAVRGAPWQNGAPQPVDDNDEFGDAFTGDEIAEATPPRQSPPGWLPGDDDTWWH